VEIVNACQEEENNAGQDKFINKRKNINLKTLESMKKES
jgi:hypothetical protein